MTTNHHRAASKRGLTVLERFWVKVAQSDLDACAIWQGAKNANGYGRFRLEGKNRYAHNVAWIFANGPIPKGKMVCHRCDNPACVRLDHLFLGTNSDNMRDMIAKGRSGHLKGAIHPKAKLQTIQVRAIRMSPLTNTQLARHYGVTRKAIAFIREGKNWKHL